MNTRRCLLIVMWTATVVTFIASIALVSAGLGITQYPIDFANLPNFGNATCTPDAVTTIELNRCYQHSDGDGAIDYYIEWIAVWRCRETGASIVDDSFAAVSSSAVANNSATNYPLGVTEDVFCNQVVPPSSYPNVVNFGQCQVWNACFFDVSMILDLQANAKNKYDEGLRILYASAGVFGFCLMLFVASLVLWCKTKDDFTELA